MNKDQLKRVPLKICEQNIHLPVDETEEQQKSAPKSSHKKTLSQALKRMSFYSKEKSQIPTKKEAKHREKEIIQFHNRNFHQRQRRLEEIFRENCRIYMQLNKQKSHYFGNFKNDDDKKSRRGHSVSCSEHNSTKFFEHDKLEKDESSELLGPKFQRRFSCSFAKGNKEKELYERRTHMMGKRQSDTAIELRRYSKNRTEILPRKHRRVSLEGSKEEISFVESKESNNTACIPQDLVIESFGKNNFENAAQNETPVYVRFKRRPYSGFRG